MDFALGGIAAMGACLFTNPLEVREMDRKLFKIEYLSYIFATTIAQCHFSTIRFYH